MAQTIAVTNIGSIARRLISSNRTASIIGITSKGFFGRLDNDWVIFLSLETHRGPLTLNLGKRPQQVAVGSIIHFLSNPDNAPSSGTVISIRDASTWEAPPTPPADLSHARRAERLSIFEQAPMDDEISAHLERFQRNLATRDPQAVAAAIGNLLGLGRGLTPAGDDVTLGLLLALNRWGEAIAPGWDVIRLNQTILPLAYAKTTTLAANLIECASQSQADERLIRALDAIVAGGDDLQSCAANLAGWGNSSGRAALAGMALMVGYPGKAADYPVG